MKPGILSYNWYVPEPEHSVINLRNLQGREAS